MGHVLTFPLACVVGPTASGKTDLAQRIAQSIDAVVLSADSMQVYKGMDIGTGKIAPREMIVEHFGIDLVDPGQAYSASLFQRYGRDVVESLDAEGRRVVVCGGTGFYIRALIDDFSFPPGDQIGNPVRDKYSEMLIERGPLAVWSVLNERDSRAAALLPPNDSKRVIRALEMNEEGISYADQKAKFSAIDSYYPTCMIGLFVDPDVLARRIENRVDSMIAHGLVDEVQALIDAGYTEAVTANQAIGYKEIVDYLEGACSLEDSVARIKTATRRYAKRQRTWFRKDKRIHWIDAGSLPNEELLARSLALIEAADGAS